MSSPRNHLPHATSHPVVVPNSPISTKLEDMEFGAERPGLFFVVAMHLFLEAMYLFLVAYFLLFLTAPEDST